MVTYDPKEWFRLIFLFHKSDTFRRLLFTMTLLGIFTAAIAYAQHTHLHLKIPTLTLFHQIAGFVISLVLVFRINTAYDRWWEGRKQWGALVNASRNLAIRLHALIPGSDHKRRSEASSLISNYAFCLKDHLRGNKGTEGFEYTETIDNDTYGGAAHRPNIVARALNGFSRDVCTAAGGAHNDYLVLSEQVGALTDICGACERIRSTPIPFAYSLFIKKVIFLYMVTMPVSFGLTVGYWAIPMVMIMFYAFASLELISEEIEDPFGTDANDLPTDELAEKIRINVKEILSIK
jgi:ion channel-forming bestrophin family protein